MKLAVVEMAYQIIDMANEIEDLKQDNSRLRRYEALYNELLNESVEHNRHMTGQMLTLLMTPGVTDALQAKS